MAGAGLASLPTPSTPQARVDCEADVLDVTDVKSASKRHSFWSFEGARQTRGSLLRLGAIPGLNCLLLLFRQQCFVPKSRFRLTDRFENGFGAEGYADTRCSPLKVEVDGREVRSA